MMDKAKYVNVIPHKEIHKGFMEKLASLRAPLDEDILSWTKQW